MKKFSVLKYGEDDAKQNALDLQEEMFPLGVDTQLDRGSVFLMSSWTVGWKDEDGKPHLKSFAVNTHGEEEAKRKATEFRDKQFPSVSAPAKKGKRKLDSVI